MWSHFEDQSFFRDVCHSCITEHVATPAQDAFMPGTDCQQVYVIQSGETWGFFHDAAVDFLWDITYEQHEDGDVGLW